MLCIVEIQRNKREYIIQTIYSLFFIKARTGKKVRAFLVCTLLLLFAVLAGRMF